MWKWAKKFNITMKTFFKWNESLWYKVVMYKVKKVRRKISRDFDRDYDGLYR